MSGGLLELRRGGAEDAVHHVRAADGDVEERALAGDLVVGHGGLVHVADVVELVAVGEMAPAGGAHHAAVPRAAVLGEVVAKGAGGVEVAVRFLGLGDVSDEVVEILLELGVWVRGERVGRALDDLVHVGVVERDAAEAMPLAPSGRLEVVDAARLLALAEVGLHRHDAVRLKARQPEARAD